MTSLVGELEALACAEDFFAYFDLDYDPRVLAAARLHILKRFHDNLAKIPSLDEMDQASQRALYREQLQSAYLDFTAGPALTQRTFPRLERARGAFVSLSSVRLRGARS